MILNISINTGTRRFFTLSLFIAWLTACDKDQHSHPQLTSGKELFDHHCARCHQKDGLGTFLKGVPANIATQKNQPQIVWHIRAGNRPPDSKMPVFRSMTDAEANKIALHLLALKRQYYNKPQNRDKFILQRNQQQ